jgi:hypothetical protein
MFAARRPAPVSLFSDIARCANNRSGAAACRCSTPGAIITDTAHPNPAIIDHAAGRGRNVNNASRQPSKPLHGVGAVKPHRAQALY